MLRVRRVRRPVHRSGAAKFFRVRTPLVHAMLAALAHRPRCALRTLVWHHVSNRVTEGSDYVRQVLLLTATISPPAGMPSLARTDPVQRLQDYTQALHFYLSIAGPVFDGIVFAENSESDLTSLRRLASALGRHQIEFVSSRGLDYPLSHGRGYGEFKLVDHAMREAQLLQGSVIVWKCTGRYIVRNIEALVRSRPQVDLYCHLRNHPYRLCDLYLLSFNRQGYEGAIEGVYRHLRNDIVPGAHTMEEVLFRRLVDALPGHVRVQRRFRHIPVIEGVRGWNNRRYDGTWDPKLLLRRAVNRVAPWVWI